MASSVCELCKRNPSRVLPTCSELVRTELLCRTAHWTSGERKALVAHGQGVVTWAGGCQLGYQQQAVTGYSRLGQVDERLVLQPVLPQPPWQRPWGSGAISQGPSHYLASASGFPQAGPRAGAAPAVPPLVQEPLPPGWLSCLLAPSRFALVGAQNKSPQACPALHAARFCLHAP